MSTFEQSLKYPWQFANSKIFFESSKKCLIILNLQISAIFYFLLQKICFKAFVPYTVSIVIPIIIFYSTHQRLKERWKRIVSSFESTLFSLLISCESSLFPLIFHRFARTSAISAFLCTLFFSFNSQLQAPIILSEINIPSCACLVSQARMK